MPTNTNPGETFPQLILNPDGGRSVRCQCSKCGEIVRLDFGTLTAEQARQAINNHLGQPGECPGFHVEFDLRPYWGVDAALALAFPEIPEAIAA